MLRACRSAAQTLQSKVTRSKHLRDISCVGQVGQDRVGNISLKLLLKIPHVIFAHTVHMPNVAYHSIIKPLWSLTFWLKNERALHQAPESQLLRDC